MPQEKEAEVKQEKRSRSRSNNKQKEAREKKEVYDLKENGYHDGSDAKEDGSSESKEKYLHKNDLSDTEDPRKPYNQIKHVFEIKVKELKNTPVLNKFIK